MSGHSKDEEQQQAFNQKSNLAILQRTAEFETVFSQLRLFNGSEIPTHP